MSSPPDSVGSRIRLSKYALEDIAELIKFSGKLTRLHELASAEVSSFFPAHRIEEIGRQISIEADTVSKIINALANLSDMKDAIDVSSAMLFDIFTKSILADAPPSWRSAYLDGWRNSKAHIVEVLDRISPNDPIRISKKAERLTYTQQAVLRDAQIITDVRPIFNSSGDDVLQLVVSHSLVIKYIDGQRENRLHVSLDAADIQKLKKLCDRADTKARTLRSSFVGCGVNVVVVGEKDE